MADAIEPGKACYGCGKWIPLTMGWYCENCPDPRLGQYIPPADGDTSSEFISGYPDHYHVNGHPDGCFKCDPKALIKAEDLQDSEPWENLRGDVENG